MACSLDLFFSNATYSLFLLIACARQSLPGGFHYREGYRVKTHTDTQDAIHVYIVIHVAARVSLGRTVCFFRSFCSFVSFNFFVIFRSVFRHTHHMQRDLFVNFFHREVTV